MEAHIVASHNATVAQVKTLNFTKSLIEKKDVEFALKIGQINFRKLVLSFFIKIFIYFTY